MHKTISCIIPAWNEEKNISRVLDVLKTYKKFDEIIVVDDGSKDNTYKIINSYTKQIKHLNVLRNTKNLGKTATILKGIKHSKNEVICLLDADLINLTHKNIDDLTKPILSNQYKLTILDRAGDRIPIWGITNCARFMGGERCFLKSDFNKINIQKDAGYLLEIIMNLYYINNHYKIKTIYCPNLFTIHQFNKMKWTTGVNRYIDMSKKIIDYSSPTGYLKQIIYIEEDNYDWAYNKNNIMTYSVVPTMHILSGIYYFTKLNLIRIFD